MTMRIKPYIPFICFFALFLAFLQSVGLIYPSDDTAHFDMLEKLGVAGWVGWRAETWFPRLFSDYFYAILIHNLVLWRIINAAVAALLMLGIWRVSGLDEQDRKRALPIGAALVCLMFFLIYPNAVTSSSIWYTGTFNYLWPIAALIFGLMPFLFVLQGKEPYPKKYWIPIGIFASLCAGFTEQTTAVAFGVSLLILIGCIRHKHRVPVWLYIHFAVIAVCAAVYLFFVFNSVRVGGGEEIALFPEFATFGKRDMLQLGTNVYVSHLLRSSGLIFTALALLAGFFAFIRLKKVNPILRSLSFLPAFYGLLNIIPFNLILSGTWFYSSRYEEVVGLNAVSHHDPSQWFNWLERVPPLGWGLESYDLFIMWFSFFAVIFMLYPLFFAFREKLYGFMACLLYLAAFGSGVIMGFSPSVFSSGARPFFLANILILLIIMLLIREGMTEKDAKISDAFQIKTLHSKLAFIGLALVSAYIIFMYVFLFTIPGYWLF